MAKDLRRDRCRPLFCFGDATGEALAAQFRPGKTAEYSDSDHLAVLDTAVGQLPEATTAGNRPGRPLVEVQRTVAARADSAGCSNGFVTRCRARNFGFAVVTRYLPHIHSALFATTRGPRRSPRATTFAFGRLSLKPEEGL